MKATQIASEWQACSPNGTFATTTSGTLLTCQNGVFRKPTSYCGPYDPCTDTTVAHLGICGTGTYAAVASIVWNPSGYWYSPTAGVATCNGGVFISD